MLPFGCLDSVVWIPGKCHVKCRRAKVGVPISDRYPSFGGLPTVQKKYENHGAIGIETGSAKSPVPIRGVVQYNRRPPTQHGLTPCLSAAFPGRKKDCFFGYMYTFILVVKPSQPAEAAGGMLVVLTVSYKVAAETPVKVPPMGSSCKIISGRVPLPIVLASVASWATEE